MIHWFSASLDHYVPGSVCMVRMDLSSTPCDWSGPVVSALINEFNRTNDSLVLSFVGSLCTYQRVHGVYGPLIHTL